MVFSFMVSQKFSDSIKRFNEMYKLPSNDKPTLLGVERLRNFKNILMEEVNEVDGIIKKYEETGNDLSDEKKLDILTDLSDWLGDMIVYITSEATKHGLNIDETLSVIMESNFSKLGADGNPIYDERGKVMKGPNYWKPEPKLKEEIKRKLN